MDSSSIGRMGGPQHQHEVKKESPVDKFMKKITTLALRIFYALRHITYSMRQIKVADALMARDNTTFNDVQFFSTGSGALIAPEKTSKPFSHLKVKKIKNDNAKKFTTFNLSTKHEGVISDESHNVSVLYDKENNWLYVIDGKATDPEKLRFQNAQREKLDQTIADFVTFLQKELDVKNVAYCKKALQRTNDCVIFPEKVMADLIKNPPSNGNPQTHLDHVLKQAEEEPNTFYHDINQIRDQCFN